MDFSNLMYSARLAQSVEHETLNLRVVGSSPTLGVIVFFFGGGWRHYLKKGVYEPRDI